MKEAIDLYLLKDRDVSGLERRDGTLLASLVDVYVLLGK